MPARGEEMGEFMAENWNDERTAWQMEVGWK